jgi:hypothetical protein
MGKSLFQKTIFRRIALHGLLPSLFYFIMFCLLTYPLVLSFSTSYFGDFKDVLQNVWDLWWVNLAVLNPNKFPTIWQTNLLHWPYGTTLFGHTLMPFNGFIAIFLLRFLSLVETYNTILILGFILGGLTSYWLSYYLTRSFWGSLLAGFIFTFSSYHLAQAHAHLNLVSLEWLPLFILFWYLLITKPNVFTALGAAVVSWMVLLCDYYYFLYCILTAILIVIWYAATQKKFLFFLQEQYIRPLIAFCLGAAILVGPVIGQLIISNIKDPLLGGHEPLTYSLDPLSLFLPGWGWIGNSLTKFHWSLLSANIVESTAYIGVSVFLLIGYVLFKRKNLEQSVRDQCYLWLLVSGFFFLLSLGPALQIGGKIIWNKGMPYSLFSNLLPFIRLSGMPVRMSVMIIFGFSIIAAIAIRELLRNYENNKYYILGLIGLLLLQTVPTPINGTTTDVPDYVSFLAGLPSDGGVVDLVTDHESLPLYYQTIHRKPIAFGYISRIPASVDKKDKEIIKTIQNHDYYLLLEKFQIRYIITKEVIQTEDAPENIFIELLYEKNDVRIYRIVYSWES